MVGARPTGKHDGWDWPLWEWKTRETSREGDGPGRDLEAGSEARDFLMVDGDTMAGTGLSGGGRTATSREADGPGRDLEAGPEANNFVMVRMSARPDYRRSPLPP